MATRIIQEADYMIHFCVDKKGLLEEEKYLTPPA